MELELTLWQLMDGKGGVWDKEGGGGGFRPWSCRFIAGCQWKDKGSGAGMWLALGKEWSVLEKLASFYPSKVLFYISNPAFFSHQT